MDKFECEHCKIKSTLYPATEYQICKRCDVWIKSLQMCYPCIVDTRIKHENEEHVSVELV